MTQHEHEEHSELSGLPAPETAEGDRDTDALTPGAENPPPESGLPSSDPE